MMRSRAAAPVSPRTSQTGTATGLLSGRARCRAKTAAPVTAGRWARPVRERVCEQPDRDHQDPQCRSGDLPTRTPRTDVRGADLPNLHSFTRGLDLDIQAATTALTMPHHNGRTEGVNTKTKMIKRQMYGRADFTLLRHRILLG